MLCNRVVVRELALTSAYQRGRRQIPSATNQLSFDERPHRKPEGDLTGITAEQIALQNHIEALQPSAAATSFVPAAARFEPGPLAANSRIGPKQAQARPKPITNRHGWKLSSLHPFGTLAEELGPIGDIEVETSALLKDCNFPTGEFSDGVLKCLLPTPWTCELTIPYTASQRGNLRLGRIFVKKRIFTIDPESGKDLDDALSIEANDDITYDVGVRHVAYVAYFVKPNAALDRDARKMATSAPEEARSLNPGVERLTSSAVFAMTKEGKIVNKWLGKTVIKSCVKLSYTDAQKAIDGHILGDLVVAPERSTLAIIHDLKVLNGLAKQLRAARTSVLNVPTTASANEIRERYRALSVIFRPDKQSGERTRDTAAVEFLEIQKAYEVSSDPLIRLDRYKVLNDKINLKFTSRLGPGPRNDLLSRNNLMGAIRHQFSPRLALEAAAHFLDPQLVVAKASYEDNDNTLNCRVHFIPAFWNLLPPASTVSFSRRLFRHASTTKAADQRVDGEQTENADANNIIEDVYMIRRSRDVLRVIIILFQLQLHTERANRLNIAVDVSSRGAHILPLLFGTTRMFLRTVKSNQFFRRYGPDIRPAKVASVLDAAFDVVVPEFGIEKRSMLTKCLTMDILSRLTENSDDEHLRKVKQNAEAHAVKMEVASRSAHDEKAIFHEDDQTPMKMRLIQDIKEPMTAPVIATADLTKSPPAIKGYGFCRSFFLRPLSFDKPNFMIERSTDASQPGYQKLPPPKGTNPRKRLVVGAGTHASVWDPHAIVKEAGSEDLATRLRRRRQLDSRVWQEDILFNCFKSQGEDTAIRSGPGSVQLNSDFYPNGLYHFFGNSPNLQRTHRDDRHDGLEYAENPFEERR
ncbi:uncharacterized protein F5891DRAFT_986476 [Suillus fuscotomentosus]|uniref:J domain-containing protein n=1 Tax=Suillus fuscotomentosus TaxID=1912939 RepID=A0AAD4DS41_9AGAM|nr:uncharacterized protein F5891DRAFT_986476 [Suillus fuscotomentosus]KAG1891849.1 hypothetical protein F5891DRAFT_986476 [Suillus fuscotomentosus]